MSKVLKSKDKLLEVREYDSIVCNEELCEVAGYEYLDKDSFNLLEELILSFNIRQESDALDFFNISSKRNVGKIIRAKNYVGIIQLKNGKQIQVLPKIDSVDRAHTKQTFLRMLKHMKNFPSKLFKEADLQLERMSLYEIFISLYIKEVKKLVKQGLKSAYYSKQNNRYFYKGKLILRDHIVRNIVRKDRFYVEFDEFGINRPENRLVKSTLLNLIKKSNDNDNIKQMRLLLNSFETIDPSSNYEKDFSNVIIDKNTKAYTTLMYWSKVFLFDKSFTTYAGDTSGNSLLFPMEKVFEAYVGRYLQRHLVDTDWRVSLQGKGYYLFERQFALRPDIVIEKDDKSRKIILDTKWKVLYSNASSNYGIAQADMYQMYAYAKKYNTNEVWIIYPINKDMQDVEDIVFKSDDGVKVKVFFVDVSDITTSICKLVERWEED